MTSIKSPVEWAMEHFFYLDKANAAIHQAQVKFSPITFDLATYVMEQDATNGFTERIATIIINDKGQYELDSGR